MCRTRCQIQRNSSSGDQWIKKWEEEYGVSLKMPNKRYSIKKEDLVERLQDFLKNMWHLRRFFIEKYGIDPPIINGDQMPLHRNESSQQKTLSFKGEDVVVKETRALNRRHSALKERMPLHRNESSQQKTLCFKGEDVVVNETRALNRRHSALKERMSL